ncbi:hypothetical protein [Streptomyces sp. CRN 30]|uniref:hypothetical protein n=1 Tax=Streptomyces sp. CRN 30 TaxID=3075613 RepID=UPI002A8336AF|nr:hypothetical protein [Streptomyces sp. CRN 30]
MSAATVTPVPAPVRAAAGARPRRLVHTLRAVKVFAGAAFEVVVLGEYDETAGVRRHR